MTPETVRMDRLADASNSDCLLVRPASAADLKQVQRLFLHQRHQRMRAQPGGSATVDSVALAFAAMGDVRATSALIEEVGGGLFLCADLNSRIRGMATLALTESYGDTTGLLRMTCSLRSAAAMCQPSSHRPHALLLSLWVEPADRGSGIGSMLVRHVLDMAAANGVQSLALTCDPASPELHAFYERFGFRPA